MSVILQGNPLSLPEEHDIRLAKQSMQRLAALLPKKEKDFPIDVKSNGMESRIILPFSAVKLLLDILNHMSEGNAVTIIPIHAELTTQQAADLLNVSRPYLIKLLENAKIPFHKTGTHRRIRFEDLMSYKEKSDKLEREALEELTRQAQELGLGY